MTKERYELTLTEWAVLGIVAEKKTHGFSVAKLLAPGGVAGEIWTVPRPLVYRAIDVLVELGFVKNLGTTSGSGPPRHLLAATPTGRAALRKWLEEPIVHVRDARSHLLMKLFLLARREMPTEILVERQLGLLATMSAGLEGQLAVAENFDVVLIRWRLCSVQALEHFLRELD